MSDPIGPSAPRPHRVTAKNRGEAVGKLILSHPTLKALYSPGPNDDGKGGWVNAIKDQRGSVYRLLFYLDRLPLAPSVRDREPYEVLYGTPKDGQPNYPRVLFTTTGGVNLAPDEIPGLPFAAAVKTDSLEIEPLSFKRDLLTKRLVERGYGYICIYDREADALRILDLQDYFEVFVDKETLEVQVRSAEQVLVSDSELVRPFLLKYVVKRADGGTSDPSRAAGRILEDRG